MDAPVPVPVLAHVAVPAQAWMERRFFGRVFAREALDLAFDIGGRVDEMRASAGDRIAAGAVLAQISCAPLVRSVERARIDLAAAERDLQRAKMFVASNATARTRAEDAADAVALAQVVLADAELALADATLTAPFDTLIVDRLVPPLSVVEPGQPVLRLHDLSELRIEVVLPERLLAEVADPATFGFAAVLPGLSQPVPLALRTFRAEADRIGQGYTVTLALPADVPPTLVPGIAAAVIVTRPDAPPGLPIPLAGGVVGPQGETSVLALTGTGVVKVLAQVPVTVASTDGRTVLADGIAPGNEIVAAGAHLLTDGQRATRLVRLQPEVR